MNKDATPERLLASTRLEARGLCRLYETKRVPGRCGRPFRVFVAIPKRQ